MRSPDAEAVVQHLRAGDLEAALAASRVVPFADLHQAMLAEGFDAQQLTGYGLYVAMLLEDETAERHVAASELLALALNIFPGAYPMAYFHARRAVALDPASVPNREHLLSFHNNPEHLMAPEEAERVAREVLDDDPANAAAASVLGRE